MTPLEFIGKSVRWPGTARNQEFELEYLFTSDSYVLRRRDREYLAPVTVAHIPREALTGLTLVPQAVRPGEIAVKVSREFLEKLLHGEFVLPARTRLRYDRESRMVWLTQDES